MYKCANSNKRKWDRRSYCVYCLKPYPKLARHILPAHKTEAKVKDFAALFLFPMLQGPKYGPTLYVKLQYLNLHSSDGGHWRIAL